MIWNNLTNKINIKIKRVLQERYIYIYILYLELFSFNLGQEWIKMYATCGNKKRQKILIDNF